MSKLKIIFVAGVHGVGKGHFCSKISHSIDADHVIASDLIKKRRKIGISKLVSGIDQNQSILVEELNRYHTSKSCILLDGHFCLYNKNMNIEFLSIKLFRELNLYYIILLTCQPAIVYNRIKQRDKSMSKLLIGDIDRLQNEEIGHAHRIANILKIPITQLNVSNDNIIQGLDMLLTQLKIII